MRTGAVRKRTISPDPVYQSVLLSQLVNRVMRSGKKSVAQRQVYRALDIVGKKSKENPLHIFEQAIENLRPNMEVRTRRIGGAAYQIPAPVRQERKNSLALRWLIQSARNLPNSQYHNFYEKLASEILAAQKREGVAMKKKDDIHRQAEANKAFSHFRW